MNTRELLLQATRRLKQAGCDAPRLDAELLLMFAWQLGRTELIIRANDTIPEAIAQAFEVMLVRREQRQPLAYITGEKEFWSRSFHVTPDVLIPRPETEHLIEAVLEVFPDQQAPFSFCDIGTGSGCIAITLACEYPHAQITATDISPASLQIAKQNAQRLGVADRVSFYQGDMLQALPDDSATYDAIISNPPYVALHEMDGLESELSHEPQHALTDAKDGLSFLSIILNQGMPYLQPRGYIIVETGTCGLPDTPQGLHKDKDIIDLAGLLRGARYQQV
ncbi:release factor glutamine methyltransferase [Mariprofundus micogutta]|uniref:Release factor glutamine methyltransferase n=1 Tax=Mariprofundus micogutta TaxID=1921010 RepID=A0A1L8CMB4_9PROT|nr:peptide chain release factor N(5)-glutamine methyltransferase [Mariprofundus micogutta]GAV19989.1 release factor glutamine methyltransferase [Mariprofundus micogutta]